MFAELVEFLHNWGGCEERVMAAYMTFSKPGIRVT